MAKASKLEFLFKIADKAKRQNAFVAYARQLEVDISLARKPDGEYDEDKLAVCIYDVEQKGRRMRLKNVGLLVGAILFAVMFTAAIFIFKKNFHFLP
jgi:hypothetical protein